MTEILLTHSRERFRRPFPPFSFPSLCGARTLANGHGRPFSSHNRPRESFGNVYPLWITTIFRLSAYPRIPIP